MREMPGLTWYIRLISGTHLSQTRVWDELYVSAGHPSKPLHMPLTGLQPGVLQQAQANVSVHAPVRTSVTFVAFLPTVFWQVKQLRTALQDCVQVTPPPRTTLAESRARASTMHISSVQPLPGRMALRPPISHCCLSCWPSSEAPKALGSRPGEDVRCVEVRRH